MDTPPRVAIMYGFAEGGWHGRKLRVALRQHGYQLVRDSAEADVIIAHSGACYLIPPNGKATTIIHVGYTYWPGRSLRTSLVHTLSYDRAVHGTMRWLARCLVHEFYMLNVVHTARMLPGWRNPTGSLDRLDPVRHIFVRNRADSYCDAAALLTATDAHHTYISLPGGHVDIWDHPERYVNLLQSVYG